MGTHLKLAHCSPSGFEKHCVKQILIQILNLFACLASMLFIMRMGTKTASQPVKHGKGPRMNVGIWRWKNHQHSYFMHDANVRTYLRSVPLLPTSSIKYRPHLSQPLFTLSILLTNSNYITGLTYVFTSYCKDDDFFPTD